MWCDLGGPGWGRSMPSPSPGAADLAAKGTPARFYPSWTEGHPCSPSLQAVSKGRKRVFLQFHHQFLPLMLTRYQAQAQYKKEP